MKYLKGFFFLVIIPLLVTVIGAGITTQLENVGFITGWLTFIEKIKLFIIAIVTVKIPLWAIFLVISLLIIIVAIYRKYIKYKKPNMRWFKKLNGEELSRYRFLFWYPLNGLHTVRIYTLNVHLKIQILKSPSIKKLIENNILSFNSFSDYLDIADEAYDFLSIQLQKQYDPENYDIKTSLKLFKESNFLELVAKHVLESAINLD